MTYLPYRAVLLDFDGTLADSAPGIIHCMRETFAAFGREEPDEQAIRKTIGLPLEKGLILLAPDIAAEELEKLRFAYRECYVDHGRNMARLYPGVHEALLKMKTAGLFTAVVSNKSQLPLEKTVQGLGLDQVIDLAVGSLPDRPGKPDPGVWDKALWPILGTSDRVLMVGDAETDLLFARAVGLEAAWAAYGYGNAVSCQSYSPEHVLESASELVPVLGLQE